MVHGRKEGRWIQRLEEGISETNWVRGKFTGQYVFRFNDGKRVDFRQHDPESVENGVATITRPDGTTFQAEVRDFCYMDPRGGRWTIYERSERCRR